MLLRVVLLTQTYGHYRVYRAKMSSTCELYTPSAFDGPCDLLSATVRTYVCTYVPVHMRYAALHGSRDSLLALPPVVIH